MSDDERVDAIDYVYPDLGREGLGNLLFPLARALVLCEVLDAQLLLPQWHKLRLGPMIRRERDLRRYHRLFLRPSPRAVAKRARVLATSTLVSEDHVVIRRRSATSTMVVRGMDDRFASLNGAAPVLLKYLTQTARPGVLAGATSAVPYVALHIRLGDFQPSESEVGRPSIILDNTSTPISWFVSAVGALRKAGWKDRILVASDGSDDQLKPVLDLPGVVRSDGSNALDDLMSLAGARLLVGSGSSFSAWGAFLGGRALFLQPGRQGFLPEEGLRRVREWDETAVQLLRTELGPSKARDRAEGSVGPDTLP